MEKLKHLLICLLICFLFGGSFPSAAYGVNTQSTGKIELTVAEQEFIEEHPLILLGVDPTFIPYEFIDSDGSYSGIAADYIKLISQITGLQMVVVENLTWNETYEKAVYKEIDALPCVAQTKARERYFIFSDSYYNFQRAVFIPNNDTITTFEDLYGKKVAIQRDSSHQAYLIDLDNNIDLSLYATVEDALLAVSEGKETAFVGNLATSTYLIKSLGITNLKYFVINSDSTDASQSLHFAVRNDWPELVSILNKALASISEKDKLAINNKWISIEENTDYTALIKIAQITGMVILLILIISVFWIIRLKKEINKRKLTEAELKEAKVEADQANQTKSLFLARMSHEIRTPLNAIMGMSYLIRKTDVTLTQSLYLTN